MLKKATSQFMLLSIHACCSGLGVSGEGPENVGRIRSGAWELLQRAEHRSKISTEAVARLWRDKQGPTSHARWFDSGG